MPPSGTTDSGQSLEHRPLRGTAADDRLSGGTGSGSSPRTTDSSRSTVAKSANPVTATSASSSAVRVTSRVLPMRRLASLSTARRRRAQYCSVVSITSADNPCTAPLPSFNGERNIDQRVSRVSPGAANGVLAEDHLPGTQDLALEAVDLVQGRGGARSPTGSAPSSPPGVSPMTSAHHLVAGHEPRLAVVDRPRAAGAARASSPTAPPLPASVGPEGSVTVAG